MEEVGVFSSLQELATRLRATGYIADSIATTTIYWPRDSTSRYYWKDQPEAERPNWHMQLHRLRTQ
jgi:hypothetical protein